MESKRKRGQETGPENKRTHKKAKSGPAQEQIDLIPDSSMTMVVKQAIQALDPEIFSQLIATVLLPVAESSLTQEEKDDVPSAFQASLKEHQKKKQVDEKQKKQAIELINLPKRRSSLYKSVSMIKASSRDRDDWENQMEMMEEAASEMLEWLNILFKVGIEMKVQFSLVVESLRCIESVISDLYNIDLRWVPSLCSRSLRTRGRILKKVPSIPFEGTVEGGDEVKSSSGAVRYKSHRLKELMFKLWRDLLLVALSQGGSDKFVKATIASFTQEDLESLKEWVMPKDQNSRDREALDNEWHTPEMDASLPPLQDLLSAWEESSG